jgi:hypothetical protein
LEQPYRSHSLHRKLVHRSTNTAFNPRENRGDKGRETGPKGRITIDNRRLFINLLSEIRLFPRRRLFSPSLGNSLSNRDINLGRRRNFVFSINFRQALPVRRMRSAGISASYTKPQSKSQENTPKGEEQVSGGGLKNGVREGDWYR